MRWEAGRRGEFVGMGRFKSGCEQGLSCQDQFARSFNGIKGLQRSILELVCIRERDIHWEVSWGLWAPRGEMSNSDRSIHCVATLGDKEPKLSELLRSPPSASSSQSQARFLEEQDVSLSVCSPGLTGGLPHDCKELKIPLTRLQLSPFSFDTCSWGHFGVLSSKASKMLAIGKLL